MRQNADMPQLQSLVANISNQYSYNEGFSSTCTADVENQAIGGGIFTTQRKVLMMAQPMLRKVQQFLTDPDDNLPLDKRVLFEGEVFLTDETDAELIYRVPVQELLAKHNEYRVTVREKKFKDKEVLLEPAKIRDLRLTTVTIAQI